MLDADALSYAFTMTPKDAVAYFRQKGYTIGWDWQQVAAETHARAFTVAKAARLDILEAIRGELDKAISNGTTASEFVRALTPRLQTLGWWGKQVIVGSDGQAQVVQLGSPWRLKNIYRCNMQSAYMAGRYKQQMENSEARPYWMYVAVLDERTRASHAALNGQVFRFDDPIWQSHYPPNGWNCRCRVRALSERRLASLGQTVGSSDGCLSRHSVDTGFDPRTGEMYTSEVTTYRHNGQTMTPDAGWSYNVGQLAYGTDVALMQKVTAVDDLALRTQVVQAINNSELRRSAFAGWVDEVLAKSQLGHTVQAIGFMDEAVATAVAERTGHAPARVLVIGEKNLVHADSASHEIGAVVLDRDQLRDLPLLLSQYDGVFWDRRHHRLMYVRFVGDGAQVLASSLYRMKQHTGRLDVAVSVFQVRDRRVFTDASRFEQLP